MPTKPFEKLTNNLFIERLMEDVKGYLPLLSSAEADQFLDSLKAVVDESIAWQEELGSHQNKLLAEIGTTTSYSRLGEIHGELNNLEMERFLKIQSVPALHRNCTDYRDALAARALILVQLEMTTDARPAPVINFALISMGSDGREEQTLITDQDYLIVYDDGGNSDDDDWFTSYSEVFVERMVEIGFERCTGNIMPSNPTWRGSMSQWRKKLLAIVRYEYEDYGKNLMDLIVLSDARYVAGDRPLADELISHIRGLEQDYFQVLWGMAKAATEMKLALGFLKRFWTEGSGEHKGEFNLKLLAWAPLVMNIRIISINQGIPTTSTVGRIELLQKEGSFSAGMAAGLIEAYHILTRYRILQQIKVIKGIQKSSYYINPYQLPAEDREQMRQALLRIEDLQKVIHTNFHIV